MIGDEEVLDENYSGESEENEVSDASNISVTSDNFSSCKSSDFDDLNNDKDNYSSNQVSVDKYFFTFLIKLSVEIYK